VAVAGLISVTGTQRACQLLSKPRATCYHRLRPRLARPRASRPWRWHGPHCAAALSIPIYPAGSMERHAVAARGDAVSDVASASYGRPIPRASAIIGVH
jgi:hypothetical protein